MFKCTEREAEDLIAEKKAKLERRWKQTVDRTRFMDELREGKLKKETIQLYYKNWGAFVPVINSIYTSAFYKHLWFFVKNVDLMEVYTAKGSRRVWPSLPSRSHPDPYRHWKSLGTHRRGSTADSDVAGSAGAARFSKDIDGGWPDSRILVLRPVGACIWRNLFGLVPRADHSLRSDHRASKLFLQTSRSRHDGSPGPKSPRCGHTNRLSTPAPARNYRTPGLFGRVLRSDAGGSQRNDDGRLLQGDALTVPLWSGSLSRAVGRGKGEGSGSAPWNTKMAMEIIHGIF